MRKIRRVIADSVIRYYDSDGVIKTHHTIGNIRNVDKAIKVLMDADIVNVMIDDIKVHKTAYVMDVDTFVANAERLPDKEIDKETDNKDVDTFVANAERLPDKEIDKETDNTK